jgi:hypothetical protein
MRKLIACLLILGIASPMAPVWARDGEKSLAGASSKKERETELDRYYEDMVNSFNSWTAAREAYWQANGQDPISGDPIGDEEAYYDMLDATSAYNQEVEEAETNKEVRGSYEFKDPVVNW